MQTEKEAIARLKRGDLDGLEFLVQSYQVKAVQAAYLILRDRAQAEDVVQAAFLNAAHKIGGFDPERPFGPWFLRSVINAALKVAQKHRRLVSLDEDWSAQAESFIAALPDEAPRPEEVFEAAETRQAIWQALEQITPEQRAAIVMRYFLGWSEEQIAGQLQRPRSTVKWWLRAGR
ncbi:MAG TPA: sigma-70 family RNA polymerase sigma factor, partial [Anaerolineales bacterium]|nr:sigma-70 family RNA polymerase sigma factor [Anaerolineales bacterium]